MRIGEAIRIIVVEPFEDLLCVSSDSDSCDEEQVEETASDGETEVIIDERIPAPDLLPV